MKTHQLQPAPALTTIRMRARAMFVTAAASLLAGAPACAPVEEADLAEGSFAAESVAVQVPGLVTPIYQGAEQIYVYDVDRSAKTILLYSGSDLIAEQPVTANIQAVELAKPIEADQPLHVEVVRDDRRAASSPIKVERAPEHLPTPATDLTQPAGATCVSVWDTPPGAVASLVVNGERAGTAVADHNGVAQIDLKRPLRKGDELAIGYEIDRRSSPPAWTKVDGETEAPAALDTQPVPKLNERLYAGATGVTATALYRGARVQLSVDGELLASRVLGGEGEQVVTGVTLAPGQWVSVFETQCGSRIETGEIEVVEPELPPAEPYSYFIAMDWVCKDSGDCWTEGRIVPLPLATGTLSRFENVNPAVHLWFPYPGASIDDAPSPYAGLILAPGQEVDIAVLGYPTGVPFLDPNLVAWAVPLCGSPGALTTCTNTGTWQPYLRIHWQPL